MRFVVSDEGMTEAQKEILDTNLCRAVNGAEAHRLDVCQQLAQFCDLDDREPICIGKELTYLNINADMVEGNRFLYNGWYGANKHIYNDISRAAIAGYHAEDYPSL